MNSMFLKIILTTIIISLVLIVDYLIELTKKAKEETIKTRKMISDLKTEIYSLRIRITEAEYAIDLIASSSNDIDTAEFDTLIDDDKETELECKDGVCTIKY